MNYTVALLAACVVVFKAVMTETGVFIGMNIIVPYNFFTAVAYSCISVNAVFADWFAVDYVVVVALNDFSSVGAVDFFFHSDFLHK